jgi:hypothetical protein
MPIAPGGYPSAGTAAMPGDPANSWIPVDPPASSAAADPVVVTVNEHGVATTVDVPAGHDVDVKIGGDGHVDVNVDGQPSDVSAAPAHTVPHPAAHTAAPAHAAPHPTAHPHPAAHPHAAAPAHPTAAAHHPAAHDVVVTVADHDVKTTIDVPAGDELKIDIDGNRVTEHLTARP